MFRPLFVFLLVSLFPMKDLSAREADDQCKKNILILFSLAPTTPAYRIILDGIRQKLAQEYGDTYSLHTEYLETSKYPNGDYPKENFDLYNKKYDDIRLDLLICVGSDIVSTVKKFTDDHILNLPA
jgi:hypothetical protein